MFPYPFTTLLQWSSGKTRKELLPILYGTPVYKAEKSCRKLVEILAKQNRVSPFNHIIWHFPNIDTEANRAETISILEIIASPFRKDYGSTSYNALAPISNKTIIEHIGIAQQIATTALRLTTKTVVGTLSNADLARPKTHIIHFFETNFKAGTRPNTIGSHIRPSSGEYHNTVIALDRESVLDASLFNLVATTIHEIGHNFGLNHLFDVNSLITPLRLNFTDTSIMNYQKGFQPPLTWRPLDHEVLKRKYPELYRKDSNYTVTISEQDMHFSDQSKEVNAFFTECAERKGQDDMPQVTLHHGYVRINIKSPQRDIRIFLSQNATPQMIIYQEPKKNRGGITLSHHLSTTCDTKIGAVNIDTNAVEINAGPGSTQHNVELPIHVKACSLKTIVDPKNNLHVGGTITCKFADTAAIEVIFNVNATSSTPSNCFQKNKLGNGEVCFVSFQTNNSDTSQICFSKGIVKSAGDKITASCANQNLPKITSGNLCVADHEAMTTAEYEYKLLPYYMAETLIPFVDQLGTTLMLQTPRTSITNICMQAGLNKRYINTLESLCTNLAICYFHSSDPDFLYFMTAINAVRLSLMYFQIHPQIIANLEQAVLSTWWFGEYIKDETISLIQKILGYATSLAGAASGTYLGREIGEGVGSLCASFGRFFRSTSTTSSEASANTPRVKANHTARSTPTSSSSQTENNSTMSWIYSSIYNGCSSGYKWCCSWFSGVPNPTSTVSSLSSSSAASSCAPSN
jgi:hypothetical protein